MVLVTPSIAVVVLAAPGAPVPVSLVHVTDAPATGPPNWSVTFTTSGKESVRPTESTCWSPDTSPTAAGGAGVAVSVTVTGANAPEAASY